MMAFARTIGDRLQARIAAFARDDSGATFMEYTLIVALLSIATLAFFGPASDTMSETFSEIADEVDQAG